MVVTMTEFFREESGATSIEYGLIASLISVMCIAAMTIAGQQLLALFNNIGNVIASAL